MAALTTFTGLSALEEIVPTEEIDSFVASFQYAVPVGLAVAWARPSASGSIPVKFPRWNALGSGVPAGTKGETDLFSDRAIDTTESAITPGLVGFRVPLSDEIMRGALTGVPAGLLVQCMNALLNRMDSDVLSAITTLGATNSTGAETDDFTLAKFRAALTAFKALEIDTMGMPAVAVIGHAAAADLLDSLHETSASRALGEGDSLRLGAGAGLLGSLHGVSVYESGNIPVHGVGHANVISAVGPGNSALAAAITEMPSIESSRGDDAVARATTYHVFRAWYGAGVSNPTKALEVLAN